MARKKVYTPEDKEPQMASLSALEVFYDVALTPPPASHAPLIHLDVTVRNRGQRVVEAYTQWVFRVPDAPAHAWSALTPQERAGFEDAAQSLLDGREPVTTFDHLFMGVT